MTPNWTGFTRKVFVSIFLASALCFSGCKSTPPGQAANQTAAQPANPATDQSASSSNPNANAGTVPTTAQQAPGRTAAVRQPAPQPGPSQPAPAPQPVAPPPPLVAPAGTSVIIRTNESLSASHNEVGDSFSGELAEPLIVRTATVFPRGTRVQGTVVAAKGRGRFKGSGALAVELTTIAGSRVQTSEYEKEVRGKGKRTGGLIGGGAGLGALIGGLAGGGKGAVIGGLAGAGAGTAGAAYTGNKDVIIPSESVVTFRLTAPLTVRR